MKTVRVCVKYEACDVPIHRPSKWGNPFPIGMDGMTRPQVVAKYRQHVLGSPHLLRQLHRLKGKRIGCYCEPGELCHGDVLIDLIEQQDKTGRTPKRTGFFGRGLD